MRKYSLANYPTGQTQYLAVAIIVLSHTWMGEINGFIKIMSFISNSVQLYKQVGLELWQAQANLWVALKNNGESILSSKVTSGNKIWGNFEKY